MLHAHFFKDFEAVRIEWDQKTKFYINTFIEPYTCDCQFRMVALVMVACFWNQGNHAPLYEPGPSPARGSGFVHSTHSYAQILSCKENFAETTSDA